MMKQPAQSTPIQNTESQVPKTPQMNDRDYLNDLLLSEKYMGISYVHAMQEASHQALYQDIKSVFDATCDHQRDLYNLMFNKGWYKFESQEPQKMQQTQQQFNQYARQQFPK
ncbi:spore coat protein [Sporolactobacillus sp. Y61]|jgi:spore coat protein CotF|uniref:Spore coat protein n=1 Tax=Sporolactobacillus sp. Y61 TaxID=3160863 RepID=A0AAU8ICR3_9BACL|nr:spore coat protein [Sporolactobacillus sp. THM19-2]RYL93548.1 spore coat protein [Sporolactobacillus sp. THM19-2]